MKIGELAIALGQQQALDRDGIRQAQMAKALLDTRREVMERVFDRCNRETTFLPNAPEIRKIYNDELRVIGEEKRREEQREAEAKDAKLRADRAAHPENFFSITDVLKERGGADAIIGDSRDRMRERLNRSKIALPEPDVRECPHCGHGIPFAIRDLSALSAADLRSMADRKAEKEEAIAAAVARKQQLLTEDAERATKAVNHRRRRDDRAPDQLAGQGGDDVPQPSTPERK